MQIFSGQQFSFSSNGSAQLGLREFDVNFQVTSATAVLVISQLVLVLLVATGGQLVVRVLVPAAERVSHLPCPAVVLLRRPMPDPCKRGRLTTVNSGRTPMALRCYISRVVRLAERRGDEGLRSACSGAPYSQSRGTAL